MCYAVVCFLLNEYFHAWVNNPSHIFIYPFYKQLALKALDKAIAASHFCVTYTSNSSLQVYGWMGQYIINVI